MDVTDRQLTGSLLAAVQAAMDSAVAALSAESVSAAEHHRRVGEGNLQVAARVLEHLGRRAFDAAGRGGSRIAVSQMGAAANE